MRDKAIYLVSVVLVLGLVTSAAKGADPNLVGWWKLDDGSGTVAKDSSRSGNDGVLKGNPMWATGKIGLALDFDGTGDYIDLGNRPQFNITGEITVAAWIKVDAFDRLWATVVSKGDSAWRLARNRGNNSLQFACSGLPVMGNIYGTVYGVANVNDGQWHHAAGAYDGSTISLYVDGVPDASAEVKGSIDITDHPVYIGENFEEPLRFWNGLIDDVRVYNEGLSAAEIQAIMLGEGYPYVMSPSPADGAMVAETWAELSWKPGDFAISHNVYLSDKFDDVNTGAAGAFIGNQAETSYIVGLPGMAFSDGLVPGTTYYWRIDEVNQADPSSPWKGPIWSFWIPPRTAYNPNPPDGAKYQQPNVTLSWTKGLNAKLNAVYFGDNLETVRNATGRPMQSAATYTPPGPLAMGKTYYWRVDEFTPPNTYKGDVWSFTTIPDILVTDPNLSGWWTFDEAQGVTAVDWSGHKNYGELRGGPKWVDGQDGGALDFDGVDDFVFTGKNASSLGVEAAKPKTVTAWVYTRDFNGGAVFDLGARSSGQDFCLRTLTTTDQWRVQYWGSVYNHDFSYPSQDVWVHLALVYNGTQSTVYANGVAVGSEARTLDTSSANPFQIGCYGWQVTYFDGLIDDVRIFKKALSPQELQAVMRGNPTRAGDPSPANGSVSDVIHGATLRWSPGEGVSQHAVYFGTDKDAVTKADATDTTGIYRGLQSTASYSLPETLLWNSGPYYWRVDEYTAAGIITTGSLWSFSVSDYVLVDDFESYNDVHFEQPDSHLVYVAWTDGFENPSANGATIGYLTEPSMETVRVHSGSQSAPLLYDNTAGAAYSQVEYTFTAQDWTVRGLQTLSLWFCGQAGNVPGQLYVKVNGVKVLYNGAPSDLALNLWRPWNIELASIGVNLQNVSSLAIGIEGVGAKGTLLLDDIRLYAYSRKLITPAPPAEAGLLLHMALDEGSGDTAGDSSGHAKNGTLSGASWHAGGYDGTGYSLSFGGDGDQVLVPDATYLNGLGAITICVWIKSDLTNTDRGFLIFQDPAGNDNNGMRYDAIGLADGAQNVLKMSVVSTTGNQQLESSSDLQTTQWQHCALVWHSGEALKFYVNGLPDTPSANDAGKTGVTKDFQKLLLGKGAKDDGPREGWKGLIDELRIYDRALPPAEVSWLGGRTTPYDEPF